jgi:hypothetical protein
MADPTAAGVGAVGLGSSILGSLFQASGAKASANAQAGQLTYQAGIANLNAQIAQQNASYAQLQGEESAAKYGIGARQTAGHIIANQAASGLDVRSGSAKQVQESQHTISTIDQNQIRENASKVAYDYETQAAGAKAQATLDTMGAANVKQAGNINVASSLIGGAGSVATKWLQASQMGLFSPDNSQPQGAP